MFNHRNSNTSDHTKTKTTDTSNVPAEQHTSNDIGKNQSIIEIKSRPLERSGAGCNEGYFIDDRSEININFQKYRMVFVVNKDAVFYKKSAFRQARKVKIYSFINNLNYILFVFFYFSLEIFHFIKLIIILTNKIFLH